MYSKENENWENLETGPPVARPQSRNFRKRLNRKLASCGTLSPPAELVISYGIPEQFAQAARCAETYARSSCRNT